MAQGDSPTQHTVLSLEERGKVLISDCQGPVDLLPPKGISRDDLAPYVGMQVRGWLNTQGQYGPYVRLAEMPGQQGASGAVGAPAATEALPGAQAPSGGEDRFARREEHPTNARRMAYSKALELAPVYYELFRTENVMPAAQNADQMWRTLFDIANRVSKRIHAAGDQAQSEPAPAPPPEPAPVKDDDDIPF